MAVKTYVLSSALDIQAEAYQRINQNERVKLQKIPHWRPFLQATFQDEKGKNRTIRLKLNSNSPYQDEQVKQGIEANEKFTDRERNVVYFINGSLTTNLDIVQKFLDVSPENEAFQGQSDHLKAFKEYKPEDEIKIKNEDFKLRLKMANKIAELELEQAKELLLRINGVFFPTPDTLEACQNLLITWMDAADHDALTSAMKEEAEFDVNEKTSILIGKALLAGLIIFDHENNSVLKVKGTNKIKMKDIPAGLDTEEQEKYFADFLTTKEGELVYQDIEKELSSIKTKNKT